MNIYSPPSFSHNTTLLHFNPLHDIFYIKIEIPPCFLKNGKKEKNDTKDLVI